MRLSYDPIYDSGLAGVLLTAVVIALLFVVTPTGVSRGRRITLLTLRGLAAIALVLTMLRPSLVRSDNRPAAATLAIAMDTSRSMTLASGDDAAASTNLGSGDAENRWQQQQRVLEQLAESLAGLDDQLNIALFRYDRRSDQIASGPASELRESLAAVSNLEPDGLLTDLSVPLESAVAASRGTPLAGIMLLSDGTQTVVPASPSESGMRAELGNPSNGSRSIDPVSSARLVAAIGVPLWTVALGPRAETSLVQDVSVQSLPETYRMFTGNEAEISFEVQSQGYPGTPIGLSVEWVDEKGATRNAATRTMRSDQSSSTEAFRIPVVAPEPGRYRLIVRARPPAGEANSSNDFQLAFVDVRPGGGRVLYLEGTPRLEQSYLRRALRRFPDLELTYRWIPRDTSKRWPVSLADDLQTGRYDVIILGDLHSAALGTEQLEQIAKSVASGTALVTLGGERAYGPGGYADSPLAKALPVKMNGSIVQPAGGEIKKSMQGQLEGPLTLKTTVPHPITNIMVGAREWNWSTLPPMPGANAIAGVKASPGVQVLLEDERSDPMLVVGEYGQGRVASLAFDSTWIWWRGGASEFHRRFWRQLMLWLLSREESDDSELQLEMTRRRFNTTLSSLLTGSIVLAGNATDLPGAWSADVVLESGEIRPLGLSTNTRAVGDQREATINAEIFGDGATPTDNNNEQSPDVAAEASAPSAGAFFPPGIHRVRVRLGDAADPVASAELPFQVVDDTTELAAIAADHAMLDRMAAITATSGGESFRPDQIDSLIERISTQRRRAERVVIEKWRLGDGPSSGWVVFLLFAGCLCSEWTLRRRWGLA
ncbi:glutamine amidotransferase [Aporhodopirellula aestuarii]|uniref:Glutamine amidotransferase n=1 Tax=Aporhodopirellula aestuarii TaxID=2950107 RepID=A0ABT0UAI4_9BACT|nr:glutamine amidotransferase [Aporhodopirellula aestuarii]MCM2373891.1 glutamine amidotransferase [Aporhodopirellula aestuarii]